MELEARFDSPVTALGDVPEAEGLEVEVNLETQRLSVETADDIPFEIEPGRKEALILGLDDIGMTFMHSDEIREFEVRHRESMPWIFSHDQT